MELTFKTEYNRKSMTAMARVLRKTIRRKGNIRSHIFGWFVVLLALLLSFWSKDGGFAIKLEPRPILTFLVALILIVVLIREDAINGYVARKRILPGTEKAVTIFKQDEFISNTEIGSSIFQYDKIKIIAETTDYFVFVFSASHAQVYDKKSISGGTLEEFLEFIEKKTETHMIRV